jgi:hypothetical protein
MFEAIAITAAAVAIACAFTGLVALGYALRGRVE